MSTPQSALVTGATGLLGRQVTIAFERANWSVTGTGFTRAAPPILSLDLSDASAIAKTLDDVKPSVVVHCTSPFPSSPRSNLIHKAIRPRPTNPAPGAANRFPDSCDRDPAAARALNVAASRSLADHTAARGITLIYISTDYVFPGLPGDAPYEASAAPAPTNLYGTTKLDGEREVLDAYKAADGGRAVVLRVPVLYGKAEKRAESAVNSLVDAVLKAQKEKVVMDHWAKRFPTNTEDVGRVIAGMLAPDAVFTGR
jgi:S-adenosylmethionine synthetase